ncbi:MAG: CAP domain-containing protein [Gaiellaceae bacterium]
MPGSRQRVAGCAALLLVAAVLFAPGSSSAGRRGATGGAGQLQSALFGQLNAVRAAHGLPRLRVSKSLTAAATAHSAQMARLGYFSHNSANGASFLQRVASYYRTRGYRSWYAGENIVWSSPDLGATGAFQLWLASPPHRANLLNPRWREVGFGAVHSSRAPGIYSGAPVTIITADFGSRTR